MLGALISAGGSILGGLLGGEERQNSRGRSKSKTRSTTTNDVHLRRMVKTAERNGFNPLTLLRAGGLAAFTDTTTSGVSKTRSRSRGSSSSSSPLGAGIAGAASDIGGAIDSGPSAESQSAANAWAMPANAPVPAANPRAEFNLLQAQLGGVKYGTLGTQPSVPVSSTYAAKPALSAVAAAGSDGSAMQPTYEAPEIMNPFPKDTGLKVDPGAPNASAFAERYGEPGDWLGGVYLGWRDLKYNFLEANKDPLGDAQRYGQQMKAIQDKAISTNVWDPPAISSFVRPVTTNSYVPPLRYRPGEEASWW